MSRIVKAPKDLLAGLMFAAIAVITLHQTWDLQFGSLRRMGPGFFPTVLAVILLGFSGVLIFRSLVGPAQPIDRILSLRALVVGISALLFGLLIGPLGFVPTLVIIICISALADPELSWWSSIVLACALTAGSVVVFVYLLKQPIVLFGPIFSMGM